MPRRARCLRVSPGLAPRCRPTADLAWDTTSAERARFRPTVASILGVVKVQEAPVHVAAKAPVELATQFAIAARAAGMRSTSAALRAAMTAYIADVAHQEDERPDGGPGVVDTDSAAPEAAGASR